MKENTKYPFICISRHHIYTDGEGVTTLVLFHGCPLDCKYCLNPRSKESITSCGTLIWHTPGSLLEVVSKDDIYFKATGGGICFGGGEPLLYTQFIKTFRGICPPEWKITVETSLNIPLIHVEEISSCIDEWIIDLKDIDQQIYRAYTKKDNSQVIENLKWLTKQGLSNKITVRIPLIPNHNDEECRKKSISFVNSLGIEKTDLFSYILPAERETYHKSLNKSSKRPYGKDTCALLKAIRQLIAEKNNINFTPHICTHEGACRGTCPVCEQEVKFIESKLQEISSRGDIIII